MGIRTPERQKERRGRMDKEIDESIYDAFDADVDDLDEEQPEPETEPEAKDAPPADGETAPETAEGEQPEVEAEGEATPDVILLKDGKTAIPYDVLANTRRQLDEANRKLAERDQSSAVAVPGMEELEKDRQEIEQALKDAREVEDDELVKALERSQRLLESSIAAKQEAYQYQARDQQTAEQELQGALDAHPATVQWQSNPDSPEWQKFKQLFTGMMQSDKDFAAMPHDQQIGEIAELTARRLGVDLPGKAVEQAGQQDAIKKAKAEAQAASVASLTGVPGSETPSATTKRPEDLGGMVEAVPTDPEELEAWLADEEGW